MRFSSILGQTHIIIRSLHDQTRPDSIQGKRIKVKDQDLSRQLRFVLRVPAFSADPVWLLPLLKILPSSTWHDQKKNYAVIQLGKIFRRHPENTITFCLHCSLRLLDWDKTQIYRHPACNQPLKASKSLYWLSFLCVRGYTHSTSNSLITLASPCGI